MAEERSRSYKSCDISSPKGIYSCSLKGSNNHCFLNETKHPNIGQQQIEFLQAEIAEKDKKIVLLESKYDEAFRDAVRYKTEATTAKAYVYSLPTKEEMTKLSRDLSTCIEEKKQLHRDLNREKAKTCKLNTDINTLKQKINELNSTLKMQSSEMEAMQYQIKCWERRRQAAALAGEVTIEDILADKSDLEVEFKHFKTKSVRREKNLLTALLKLKNEIDNFKNKLNESEERECALKETNSTLQNELTTSKQHIADLQSTNNHLKEEIESLSHQLNDLRCKDEDREKNNVYALRLVRDMNRCRIALERMMEFIQDVLQGQFLDPALLFSVYEGDGSETLDSTNIATDELKKLVERRSEEADSLKMKLENCQKQLMKIYADSLSSSITNQCNIQ